MIPVAIVAALVIAIVSILTVIVPTMPLVAVVPIAVAISEGDRSEVDLDDARAAAISALEAGSRLDPAVSAVAVMVPVIVDCAMIALVHAIIVMMAPAIPMMISVPVAVAIPYGDIAETDLNADPAVVVTLRGRSAGRREHCACERECNDCALQ